MRVPIGISDFKELVTNTDSKGQHYFYCDKSILIKDIIDEGAKVMLFTRPRRFGKTLNMSMLYYFFDVGQVYDPCEIGSNQVLDDMRVGANRSLFNGLAISKNQHIMDVYQGKHPTIFISFADVKNDTFEKMYEGIVDVIRGAFSKFEYALNKNDAQFASYFDYGSTMKDIELTQSLRRLSTVLEKYHNKKVVLLIDEYDTPIQSAYVNGFYEDVINIFRMVFGASLKDNTALFKSVLTGITRISQASMFSGMNHFEMYDIDAKCYSQYFGFTEEEVASCIPEEHLVLAKEWYNGYQFGGRTIYNPWSILKFLKNGYDIGLYWVNTADHSLIKETVSVDKMAEIQTLIDGGTIDLRIDPNIILDNLETNKDGFFNLLYTAGYLTVVGNGQAMYHKLLRIPNKEILELYKTVVIQWFGQGKNDAFLTELLEDLIQGHIIDLQIKLQELILETMSFHDVGERTQESFYHGFLLGLTLGLRGRYHVNSNRESGYGRYDIALFPKNPAKDPGVIIEVKFNTESAESALKQIKDKHYQTELTHQGCTTIRAYGIHFDGKTVTTKMITV